MARTEFEQGRGNSEFSVNPDENNLSLQERLERVEQKLEQNEANENIIERETKWEQLIEEKDTLLDEINSQNASDF